MENGLYIANALHMHAVYVGLLSNITGICNSNFMCMGGIFLPNPLAKLREWSRVRETPRRESHESCKRSLERKYILQE